MACPWYIGVFALGMAAAEVVFAPKTNWNLSPNTYLWIAVATRFPRILTKFVSVQSLGHGVDSWAWYRDVLDGIMIFCVLVYCGLSILRMVDGQRPFLVKLLESRFALFLGAFSYSLYLTHFILLEQLIRLTEYLHTTPFTSLMIRTFVGIPIAVGFAYCFYLLFERPFLASRARLHKETERPPQIDQETPTAIAKVESARGRSNED